MPRQMSFLDITKVLSVAHSHVCGLKESNMILPKFISSCKKIAFYWNMWLTPASFQEQHWELARILLRKQLYVCITSSRRILKIIRLRLVWYNVKTLFGFMKGFTFCSTFSWTDNILMVLSVNTQHLHGTTHSWLKSKNVLFPSFCIFNWDD